MYNIQENYTEEDESWTVMLVVIAFGIHYTLKIPTVYTPGQLIIFHYIIISIKNNLGW